MTATTASSPSALALLVTALDHLDMAPDPQQLAERVGRVCEEQGLVVTPEQARAAATQALEAPLVDQEPAIQAHLAQRPADRRDWTQQRQTLTARLKRMMTFRRWSTGVMGLLPGAVVLWILMTGAGPLSWEMVSVVEVMLGPLSATLGFLLFTEAVSSLERKQVPLEEGDPTWGTDDQGRHWSQSPQALRVYQRLMATEVPLLVEDTRLLSRLAQTEWQAQRDQRIHERLKGVTA